MNKYRIKHVAGLGYFPQVKVGFSCSEDRWERIASYGKNQYALCASDGNPMSSSRQAENLIRDYDASLNTANNPTYKDFIL
jgi:hypothetical protein